MEGKPSAMAQEMLAARHGRNMGHAPPGADARRKRLGTSWNASERLPKPWEALEGCKMRQRTLEEMAAEGLGRSWKPKEGTGTPKRVFTKALGSRLNTGEALGVIGRLWEALQDLGGPWKTWDDVGRPKNGADRNGAWPPVLIWHMATGKSI